MENATKALLIAGSVLIAILLIAVGLRIFNSTQGTVESTKKTMDTTSITMFNSQFTQYRGTQSESNTRALIEKVIVNNTTNKNHLVKVFDLNELNATSDTGKISSYLSTRLTSGSHYIRIKYDSKGYVNYVYVDCPDDVYPD